MVPPAGTHEGLQEQFVEIAQAHVVANAPEHNQPDRWSQGKLKVVVQRVQTRSDLPPIHATTEDASDTWTRVEHGAYVAPVGEHGSSVTPQRLNSRSAGYERGTIDIGT